MAESTRRTAAELVDKPMGEEHGDVVRESVAWLCRVLIEAEVSAQIGADHGEVSRRPRHPAQRLPPEELRNARRRATHHRVGLVAEDSGRQTNALDLWFDRAYVAG